MKIIEKIKKIKIRIIRPFTGDFVDFWIGFYYNRKKRRLYVFILPMIGFWIQYGRIEKE